MISLIKIRLQYIKRHLCLLVFTYLFIPIIILLFCLFNIGSRANIKLVPYNSTSKIISEDILFFKESYLDLKLIINGTLIVVDDIDLCDQIESFLYSSTDVPVINCTNNENIYIEGFHNTIKIKGKKGKYKIFID